MSAWCLDVPIVLDTGSVGRIIDTNVSRASLSLIIIIIINPSVRVLWKEMSGRKHLNQ